MELPIIPPEIVEQQDRMRQLEQRINDSINFDPELTIAEMLSVLNDVSKNLLNDCLKEESDSEGGDAPGVNP